MITKLIIHPDLPTRVGEMEKFLQAAGLKKDHVDALWLPDEKLGVEQAKKIRQHLSLKPYSAQGRAVVVENFSVMTDEAQNSLLKTLEEPPVEAIILLGTESERNILPTILSRVERVMVKGEGKRGKENASSRLPVSAFRLEDIEKLIQSSIEQRFEYIEKLEEKEAFLHELLEYFHLRLLTTPNPYHTDFAKDLLKAEGWVEANGNIRAILEYLMLKLSD